MKCMMYVFGKILILGSDELRDQEGFYLRNENDEDNL